ncbi:Terpenoid synthase [Lasallia pustulata]|uniref:Terpenoid synthase n=1 Tax=Lasallia pustulata TaxID=136370 RepID=A0A1W5D7M7_9LECA|nr:Terpenoid synthase [Lasallia pustulata]
MVLPPTFIQFSGNRTIGQTPGNIDLTDFLLNLPPNAGPIIERADPIALVNRMLPASIIHSGARFVAACFWSWLCVVDDLTEDSDTSNSLEHCITALSSSPYLPLSTDNLCLRRMGAFQHVIQTSTLSNANPTSVSTVEEAWKPAFWAEILTVVEALNAEKDLQGRAFSMAEWMDLRILTISARPFMVLTRASLGLSPSLNTPPPSSAQSSHLIPQLQFLTQVILGFQNDILGWQNDHLSHNPLNAIEVLIRDGDAPTHAFEHVLLAHNELVGRLVGVTAELETGGGDDEMVRLYVRVLAGFGNAMAEWMLGSERYQV